MIKDEERKPGQVDEAPTGFSYAEELSDLELGEACISSMRELYRRKNEQVLSHLAGYAGALWFTLKDAEDEIDEA